jgi:membrane protease YdiL (CAAX protease family)
MTQVEAAIPASLASHRGLWGTLRRIGALRLVVMGFVLLTAFGFSVAFHFEYLAGHIAFAYSSIFDWAGTLGLCLALMGLYALLVRLFEARWPSEARPLPLLLLVGMALGVGLFCCVYAIYAAMGAASFRGVNGFNGVGLVVLVAFLAGFGEEILFRGVVFRVLEESVGTLLAMILSAALFGLMHAGNHGATTFSTIAVALEAGGMLAAAYVWSRSLWLPIGIHLAWNATQGGLFSAPISGRPATGLLNMPLSPAAGPLITGGAFGPEASIVALCVCGSLGVVFVVLAIRSGRWQGLRFRLVLD